MRSDGSAATNTEQVEVTLAVLRLRARELSEAYTALDEILRVAERMRGGDVVEPEEWYAARDCARLTLDRIGRLFDD